MAKDATPDRIKLANDNFSNENHKEVVDILLDEWDEDTTLSGLAEKYDGEGGRPEHSKSMFQKAYKMYIGVSEEQFNDGIHDPRTIEQIKRDHGKLKNYLEKREAGEITQDDFRHYLDPEDLEPREPPEPEEPEEDTEMVTMERAMEMAQEMGRVMYQQGWEDRGKTLENQN